jgi:hypothetical protein
VRDEVSQPYKRRGKIIVVYVLSFVILYKELEDKRFCTK